MRADANKQLVQDMIAAVWTGGDLDALGRYWTTDCRNHADPTGRDGLAALRAYHETFGAQMAGLSDWEIAVVQQVAEGDRVVTHLRTTAVHTGDVAGVAATGRPVRLESMRVDRVRDGRIAEHWSVADLAGLLDQLRP